MTKKIFSLKGKNIVLTGAEGFFGKHFVEGLLEYGARLILIDNSNNLFSFQRKLKKKFGSRNIQAYTADFYNRDETKKIFDEIIKKEKKIDVLINNAFDFSLKTGFNDKSGRLENATYEQLLNSFNSGIYWAFLATQLFGKAMKKHKGSIINICSMYSVIVPDPELYKGTEKFNPPGYSMTKAGLLQFTKYSAAFLSPNVRVNAMSPGAFPVTVATRYKSIDKNNPVLKRLHEKTLLKRMGHPNDLIGALIFLASDASEYMTGQNIIIDGGITIT